MANFNFNAATVAPMAPRSFAPLPEGNYEMLVSKSDVRVTKDGNGEYIELEMQVVSGEHTGRRHWERLNVNNKNKQAEEISRAALASLCLAIGVTDIDDTQQLHDIPFVAAMEIDRKDPTRNKIVGYSSVTAAQPAPAPARAAAPAPAAAPGKKPWQ